MEQLDLSGFFTTKTQAADFATRLVGLAEKIYETKFDLEKLLMEQFGVQKKDRFMTLMRNNNISTSSNSDIKNFVDKIQEKIKSLPTLSLMIAFEPDEKTLRSISEWFLININRQVLLEIQIKRDLIAGATIGINGKYFDFSTKKQFEDILDGVVTKAFRETPPAPSLGGHQNIEHVVLAR